MRRDSSWRNLSRTRGRADARTRRADARARRADARRSIERFSRARSTRDRASSGRSRRARTAGSIAWDAILGAEGPAGATPRADVATASARARATRTTRRARAERERLFPIHPATRVGRARARDATFPRAAPPRVPRAPHPRPSIARAISPPPVARRVRPFGPTQIRARVEKKTTVRLARDFPRTRVAASPRASPRAADESWLVNDDINRRFNHYFPGGEKCAREPSCAIQKIARARASRDRVDRAFAARGTRPRARSS